MVQWGPIEEHLQLGIEIISDADYGPAVRLALRNVGSARRELPPDAQIQITAVSDPRASDAVILNVKQRNKTTPGFIPPNLVRLAAHESQTFVLPLKLLVCTSKNQDIPLDTLLNEGYSVRAVLDISRTKVLTPYIKAQKDD